MIKYSTYILFGLLQCLLISGNLVILKCWWVFWGEEIRFFSFCFFKNKYNVALINWPFCSPTSNLFSGKRESCILWKKACILQRYTQHPIDTVILIFIINSDGTCFHELPSNVKKCTNIGLYDWLIDWLIGWLHIVKRPVGKYFIKR